MDLEGRDPEAKPLLGSVSTEDKRAKSSKAMGEASWPPRLSDKRQQALDSGRCLPRPLELRSQHGTLGFSCGSMLLISIT